MKSTFKLIVLFLTFFVQFSCNDSNDEPNTKSLDINIQGLDPLGSDFVYEGWLIVNGNPVSTGVFTDVNFPKSFSVATDDLEMATKFVLSIEPTNDTDPAPSNTKILAGDFNNDEANLTTGIVGDFSTVMGKYILATPTNGADTNENSGIWFLDLPNSMPPPTTGLTLPILPEGWKYEGWVVINGTPVTTGKFTNVNATDEFNGYSGNEALPMPNGTDGFFPGEDFLNNPPSGLTFPTDLSGMTAVISVEPNPDNSPMPFTLKPLVNMIPNNASDHVTYMLNANLSSLPTGMANR